MKNLRLIYQVRHIVECNGSEEVLKRVDCEIGILFYKLKCNH
jgi:hypothetical protein